MDKWTLTVGNVVIAVTHDKDSTHVDIKGDGHNSSFTLTANNEQAHVDDTDDADRIMAEVSKAESDVAVLRAELVRMVQDIGCLSNDLCETGLLMDIKGQGMMIDNIINCNCLSRDVVRINDKRTWNVEDEKTIVFVSKRLDIIERYIKAMNQDGVRLSESETLRQLHVEASIIRAYLDDSELWAQESRRFAQYSRALEAIKRWNANVGNVKACFYKSNNDSDFAVWNRTMSAFSDTANTILGRERFVMKMTKAGIEMTDADDGTGTFHTSDYKVVASKCLFKLLTVKEQADMLLNGNWLQAFLRVMSEWLSQQMADV